MKLTSQSFRDGGPIPGRCAFGAMDAATHVHLSLNRSPDLSWHDAPAGTRSFVLICVDPDAPSKPDDVNQEGRSVPGSLPRTDFVHWVMVDIPETVSNLAEGACGSDVTPRGKQLPPGPDGARQGVNDYTGWFKGDADMAGTYLGYDGPCPPWNDEIPHRYRFELYATDLERCPVDGAFTAADVHKALAGHVLAKAELTGLYTLNPAIHLT
jgi:Raf kinase inhibitor-like YbhB/YbcL family protein